MIVDLRSESFMESNEKSKIRDKEMLVSSRWLPPDINSVKFESTVTYLLKLFANCERVRQESWTWQ